MTECLDDFDVVDEDRVVRSTTMELLRLKFAEQVLEVERAEQVLSAALDRAQSARATLLALMHFIEQYSQYVARAA